MMYQFDNLYEENEPEITNKDIKKGVKPNMITISKITTSNIDDKKGSMGGGDNINTTTSHSRVAPAQFFWKEPPRVILIL